MQDLQKELMLRFLTRNYPVHRIKHNMRFKRTIILDNDEIYQLSDKIATKQLYTKLMKILETVFSSDDKINKDVLKKFLNLK